MSQCFVCDAYTFIGGNIKHSFNLFSDDSLSSGKLLSDVAGEVVEKPLNNESAHSKVVCKKCHKLFVEYDAIQTRLKVIKTELLTNFKKTLEKRKMNYDTYPRNDTKISKNIVLPASKLQPLPANYVFDVGKVPTAQRKVLPTQAKLKPITTTTGMLNLKVTVGTSVLTQSIKTTTSLTKDIEKSPPKDIDKAPSILLNKKPMLTFNIEDLPKDFLSSAIMTKVMGDKTEKDDNDEQAMEIDEDCTLAVVPVSGTESNDGSLSFIHDKNISSKKLEDYLDVELVPMADSNDATDDQNDGKFIFGKLEIMNDHDDDVDTIVMEDEHGSIIRVVSGQKILCNDREISLVMPDDNSQDNVDSHDSNDESQIELQVSGDEETANAIIAAAQEQGGAFIKVENGEMYRVKSVQSSEGNDVHNMVKYEDGEFKCLLCEESDVKLESPTSGDGDFICLHLRQQHGQRVFVCHVCHQLIPNRADYTKHVEEHAKRCKKILADKVKMHECPICKKKYSSRTVLNEHINVHSGARPYSCDVCHKTFASKYTHQAHVKIHLERPRPFKCTQCNKSFFTMNNLSQHIKTHSGVKEFICNICGKAFGTAHNLEMHGVVHSSNKPFQCSHCGKGFARRPELRDHIRVHTGERPFACEECGARFSQRSNLHSHKRATHLDDKRYHCHQCPKRFKRRRLLEYHIKASHTGERPLKCETCRATFVYPEHYKKHIRIHSGDKPYVCEVCGKSFNSRDNRNTHRFVHSDKKPYECLVCGAGYMRKQLLYAHMNTSGHLAESIVVNQPRVQKAGDIFEVTEELELENDATKSIVTDDNEAKLYITDNKKFILDDKGSLNLVQEGDDPTILSLHNIEADVKADTSSILDGVTVQELDNAQIVTTTDENGSVVRLVQIHLADGNNGWVAIN